MARPEYSRLSKLLAVGRQHLQLSRVETDYEKLEVLLAMVQATRMNKADRRLITISLPAEEYERLGQVAEQFSTRRRQVARGDGGQGRDQPGAGSLRGSVGGEEDHRSSPGG